MARTGTEENKAAQAETAAQQKESFNTEQTAIGDYSKNVKTLEAGGSVGKNPFLDPGYLGNISKLRSGTLNAQNDAAKTQLEDLNTRTGGLGESATRYGISDLALKKMRLSDQLGSQQAAGDYTKNLDWQQYLAGAPLAAAGAESGAYATATGGRSAALKNLTDFGLAQYGPWNSLIKGLAGGAAGAASAG